jgi:TonB family protein
MTQPVCVSAQQTNQAAPNGMASHYESSGVTAKGEKVIGRQSRDNQAPWQKDLVKSPTPKYPYQARAHHWQGSGLFRIDIDLMSGQARQVTMLHSTGVPMLDESSVSALKVWRFKPNTWKSVDVPVTFTMVRPR